MRVLLHDIAHCRAGDKGTIATLSLIPYDDNDYPMLRDALTVDRVRAHLASYVSGEVARFDLPRICALQFVCHGVGGGGVTTSLALDTHGKVAQLPVFSVSHLTFRTDPSGR